MTIYTVSMNVFCTLLKITIPINNITVENNIGYTNCDNSKKPTPKKAYLAYSNIGTKGFKLTSHRYFSGTTEIG